MRSFITPVLLLPILCSIFGCASTVQQGTWRKIMFMDCNNRLYHVTLCLTGAQYDSETGYLKVEGRIKNLLTEERRFDLRNWVFPLDGHGRYLKARSVGLPVIMLEPKRDNRTSPEESFTMVFKLQPSGYHNNETIYYADQFSLTGKINKIILSVSLKVTNGTVTARG
jgi:hypothetical protein